MSECKEVKTDELIERKDDTDEKPDFHFEQMVHRGVAMFKCEIEDIEQMDTRKDDIWVCSFSRSGTTMTQEITYLVQTLDFETANTVYLDDRFPYLELEDDRFPFYRGVKYIDQMKSPRMIKSHLHHILLPIQLQRGKGRVCNVKRSHRHFYGYLSPYRIIYIARNPKDIATSFFRLIQWMGGFNRSGYTFDTFVDTFVNGTGHNCPWPRHFLEFWERRNDKNVLFLKYEEVVRDKPKAVRQIADFLGRKLADVDVANVCDHCSVENMKNNPMCNLSYWRKYKKVYDNSDGGFINQGKAGTWKQLLTPETAKKIDKLLDEIEGSGLTFSDD